MKIFLNLNLIKLNLIKFNFRQRKILFNHLFTVKKRLIYFWSKNLFFHAFELFIHFMKWNKP